LHIILPNFCIEYVSDRQQSSLYNWLLSDKPEAKMTILRTWITALALTIPFSAMAASTTSVDTVTGQVNYADTLTSSFIQQNPVTERVCQIQDVPIYAQAGEQSDELGSMIIGGLIGSAVGNGLTSKDGAGTAGAVAGALLGRNAAKQQNNANQRIVGYRQENVCENVTTVRQDRVETITGYRLTVTVDGKRITVDSNTPYNSGDTIILTRKTTYSLR
jgi:uncharacterized protein YcfJ